MTGTSYGVIAPLVHGVTNIVVEAEFDAQSWYGVLAEEKVTVWYTAPTAIRMMMKAGEEALHGFDLSSLRFAASVGEPLNPEAVVWGVQALGLPFHDNWWQTETGGIMIANFAAMDIKPGSMGRPLPGVEARIVAAQARWRRRHRRYAGKGGRTRAQARLAFHDARLSSRRRALPEMFRRRLVSHRRSRPHRRRRLFLVRRAAPTT